jgi:hypothetical protein
MFWNDIEEIKQWMIQINGSIDCLLRVQAEISETCIKAVPLPKVIENGLNDIKECVSDLLESEDENNSFNRMHDKLDGLLADANRVQSVLMAEKTMDKFEDYMKNVDKVNSMINEFKGCVSMARGAIGEGKELQKEVEGMKSLASISQQIYNSMLSFIKAAENMKHEAHFKMDAIYKVVCCKEDKPKKPRKSSKKL